MNRVCKTCNIEKDEENYLKDKTVCKNCYEKKEEKINNQKAVIKRKEKLLTLNNISNRTLINGFSNCGETYLMNHILFEKQEPLFVITKSLNQYPNIKAQTSDEIQPLNEYENSNVVFDDMLLSKQESNFDLFSTRGRHKNIDIYTTYLKAIFISQKKLFLIILI